MPDPTRPAPAALELRAVVKRYGTGLTEVRALTDVSIRVEPGELLAIMGPSGCGKSSMLHLAGALEDPDAGHVLVGGRDLSTLSGSQRAALRRTDVGFVFQRLNLVPSLTAMENVMPPRELESVPAREARERARAGEGLALLLGHVVRADVRRGTLVRLPVNGTPVHGLWCASMLGHGRSVPGARALQRFTTTPDATAAAVAPSGAPRGARALPPVHVTLWS